MAGSVTAAGLGKRFRRFEGDQPATLRGMLAGGWRRGRSGGDFWALRDVDLTVRGGEMLGVIGHNGSGKSTLLRLLGGVMRPDAGRVSILGRVSGLLEPTMGMHPDLTGRENALISGIIAGLSRREVTARFDSIVDFAELDAFIDRPLRTYSVGMKMRLGFSVAMHVNPGVLLVDEVLAVGDLAFQRKCLQRVRQFMEDGSAIVLITHDMASLADLCTQALWLRGGRVAAHGSPAAIIEAFKTEMLVIARSLPSAPQERAEAEAPEGGAPDRAPILPAAPMIANVRVLAADGKETRRLPGVGPVTFEFDIASPNARDQIHAVVVVGNNERYDIVNLNSDSAGGPLVVDSQNRTVSLRLDALPLAVGKYSISVGIYDAQWSHTYDYHSHAYDLEVVAAVSDAGVFAPPHRWTVKPPAPMQA